MLELYFIYFVNNKSIKVQSPEVTLDDVSKLISEKVSGAYMRFGDGDINLANGFDDLYQKSSAKMNFEMKEALSISGNGIMKCLPIHSKLYGHSKEMTPGYHLGDDTWVIKLMSKSYRYFIGEKIYSPIALSYCLVFNVPKAISFLRIIKAQETIFVGNNNIKYEIRSKIFGEHIFIESPPRNSYEEIDRIFMEIKSYLTKNKFLLIVIATGCSGRVLQKRLIREEYNCFILDFGSSIDYLTSIQTRQWMIEDNNIHSEKISFILDNL